jgi:hypothetical protein
MARPLRKAACHPDWSARVSNSEAYRRAGGRRHHHRIMHLQAIERRIKVLELAMVYGYPKYGSNLKIAKHLGVSPAVVCMDLKKIFSGEFEKELKEKYSKKKTTSAKLK